MQKLLYWSGLDLIIDIYLFLKYFLMTDLFVTDTPVIAMPQTRGNNLSILTDSELYKLCRLCGANIRTFNKEFVGYLPEVEKRKLFKKYGCHNLYEFAAKLAGMS